MGLQPYYNTTEDEAKARSTRTPSKMMKSLVGQLNEPLPETLSPALLAEHHLMPLTDALMNIHFPSGPDVLRKAEYRLKFEEPVLCPVEHTALCQRQAAQIPRVCF